MQDNFEIPNYNDSIMLQKQIVKGHGDTGEGGHGHAEKWWHDKVAYQIYPKSFAIQTEMGSVTCGALFPNWTI